MDQSEDGKVKTGARDRVSEGPIDLIETMRFDPVEGLYLLERHLARMRESAIALGYAFDRHDARNALQAATFRLADAACVRLVLGPGGGIAIESRAIPGAVPGPARVTLALFAGGGRHATIARADPLADAVRDTLFVTADGLVADGGHMTPFVADGATLLTPALRLGMRAGILRAELIAQGRAREAELRIGDLADGFLLGTALRGLIPARIDRTKKSPCPGLPGL